MSKKKGLLRMLGTMMVAVLCVGFASCGDDDDVVPLKDDGYQQTDVLSNQDPEGTITLNMNNGAKDNYYDLGSICKVRIDEANNFIGEYTYTRPIMVGEGKFSYQQESDNLDIVSIGTVKGLSEVTTIPTTGWSKSVAVVPGTGYMLRKENETYLYKKYIRIYVVDYIVGTNGGIIGATIKYQAPFSQTIKLDKSSLTFTSKASSQTVNLAYPTCYEVTEKPDWCTITTNENSIQVHVSLNPSTQRSGKIVLKNLVNTAELSIVQQGAAYFESGSGTSSDPYTIKTAQQLQNMNYAKGYYYVLVSDIDLSPYINATDKGWTPIGTKETPFWGTFDGRNHTISGVWINQPTSDNIGLFGYIDGSNSLYYSGSATIIKNIVLKTNNKGIIGNTCIGGICGYLYGKVNINNCIVDGIVSGEDYVGGICGGGKGYDGVYYPAVIGEISNCISKGVIKSSGSNRGQILGGNIDSNYPCTITNCSSTATLQDK